MHGVKWRPHGEQDDHDRGQVSQEGRALDEPRAETMAEGVDEWEILSRDRWRQR